MKRRSANWVRLLTGAVLTGALVTVPTTNAQAVDRVDPASCEWDALFKGEYTRIVTQHVNRLVSQCYANAGDKWFGDGSAGIRDGYTFHSGNNAGYLIVSNTDKPNFGDYLIANFEKNESYNIDAKYVNGLVIY